MYSSVESGEGRLLDSAASAPVMYRQNLDLGCCWSAVRLSWLLYKSSKEPANAVMIIECRKLRHVIIRPYNQYCTSLGVDPEVLVATSMARVIALFIDQCFV